MLIMLKKSCEPKTLKQSLQVKGLEQPNIRCYTYCIFQYEKHGFIYHTKKSERNNKMNKNEVRFAVPGGQILS